MKQRITVRIFLLFLILVIGTFDRHLSYYFPGDVKVLIHEAGVPSHSDLPVKSCDYHEDITIRTVFCAIPSPTEMMVHNYRIYILPFQIVSPHTVWQPPELKVPALFS
jgi:hypothetical protein